MSDEKTITEVIQAMDNKINQILQAVNLNVYQYNLILEKLNKFSILSKDLIDKKSVATNPPQKEEVIVKQPPKPSQAETSKSPFYQPSDLKQKITAALAEAQKDRLELKEKKIEIDFKRNVQTHQKICYADGKPMFQANVDILDETETVIKQLKTNQSGKWTSPLVPGEYKIRITKGANTNRAKIENTYHISIPPDQLTLDLGTKLI